MPAKIDEEVAMAIMLSSDFEPIEKYPGSTKPWRSLCKRCGEVVNPRLSAVKEGRRQCGFCSGARVKESTAISLFESVNLIPIEVFPGAKKPWKSKCNICKRIVNPMYANVRNGHSGCAFCSGKKVDAEEVFRIMLTKNLKPIEDFKSSSAKWRSICLLCDAEVNPRWSDIRQGQGGCPKCGNIKTANSNKLGAEFAVRMMRQAGVEPLEEYENYDKPWRSRCMSCGKETSPRLHSILAGQGACKYCGGKVVDVNFAERVMQDAGFIVSSPFPGTGKPWESICKNCKRKVSPTYGNIKQGGGCKYCNAGSFKSSKPAILYLITSESLGSHKIGIANVHVSQRNKEVQINPRIAEHIRLKWKVFKVIEFESGLNAFEVEQEVLVWLKKRNLGVFLSKDSMPQGGHTETIDAAEIDLATIWAKVEQLSKVKR